MPNAGIPSLRRAFVALVSSPGFNICVSPRSSFVLNGATTISCEATSLRKMSTEVRGAANSPYFRICLTSLDGGTASQHQTRRKSKPRVRKASGMEAAQLERESPSKRSKEAAIAPLVDVSPPRKAHSPPHPRPSSSGRSKSLGVGIGHGELEFEKETRKSSSRPESPIARNALSATVNPHEDLFLEILDNSRDTAYLRHFFVSEFIDELLDFYLLVDEWRSMWLRYQDKSDMKKYRKAVQQAVDIYVWFLRDGAVRRVNIPISDRVHVESVFAPIQEILSYSICSTSPESPDSAIGFAAAVAKANAQLPKIKLPKDCPEADEMPIFADLFDEAQKAVLDMMLIEPFVRFVDSSDFQLLQEEKAKRPPRQKEVTRRKRILNSRPIQFSDLNDNPDLYKAFEGQLKREYAEEYLYFWGKLRLFLDTKSGSSLKAQANALYEKYIIGEKVHVSPTLVGPIAEKIKVGEPDRHMFDLIRSEVEGILKTRFYESHSSLNAELRKSKKV